MGDARSDEDRRQSTGREREGNPNRTAAETQNAPSGYAQGANMRMDFRLAYHARKPLSSRRPAINKRVGAARQSPEFLGHHAQALDGVVSHLA